MSEEPLTVGSLFSGIGGLDLGLERAGMQVIWQSEIDPYACKVLAKHWPDVPNLGDITTIDWSSVERPDLVCGGYPCQPFSLAGRRQGESDPRHLWPAMGDAVRLLRPRYALLENVPGHLALGFGQVLGELAELGYDCEWDCIPAAAVGAPHLRYRVFVVAHTGVDRLEEQRVGGPTTQDDSPNLVAHTDNAGRSEQRRPGTAPPQLAAIERDGDVADPHSGRRRQRDAGERCLPVAHQGGDVSDTERKQLGQRRRLQLEANGENEQHVRQWAVEPDVGRVAHGVPHRVDRLRCLGNAVVPQVAEWIGRRILEAA